MAAARKATTQPQLQIQRRGSTEDTMRVIDPNMLVLEEIRKIRQEMKELRHEMKEDLRESSQETRDEMKEIRSEIRRDLKKELDNFGRKMEKMTQDISKTQKEVEKIKEKTDRLDKTSNEISQLQVQQQSKDLMNELRYRDKCIKIRGLEEKSKEDLYTRIIPVLAEYIDYSEERMEAELDNLFRINSNVARDRKIPRDILVCFMKSRTKDKIIQRSYEQELIIEGNALKIFKDIPPQIMTQRQKYKPLIQLLRNMRIDYRWERIEGLTVIYEQRRYKIDNLDKAREMEKRLLGDHKDKGNERREKKFQTKEWRASKDRIRNNSGERKNPDELEAELFAEKKKEVPEEKAKEEETVINLD